jgi:hypothetical protein
MLGEDDVLAWKVPALVLTSATALVLVPHWIVVPAAFLGVGALLGRHYESWFLFLAVGLGTPALIYQDTARALGGGFMSLVAAAGWLLFLVLLAYAIARYSLIPWLSRIFGVRGGDASRRLRRH